MPTSILTSKIFIEFYIFEEKKHHQIFYILSDESFPADVKSINTNVCLSPKSLLRLVIDHDDLHNRKLYKTVNSDGKMEELPHNVEDEYNDFVNNVLLTPVAFMKLCPALLAQIDQHVCVSPAPLIDVEYEDSKHLTWSGKDSH